MIVRGAGRDWSNRPPMDFAQGVRRHFEERYWRNFSQHVEIVYQTLKSLRGRLRLIPV